MGNSNCGGCGSCCEEELGFSDRFSLTSSSCSRTSLNRCSKDGICSYDDDDDDDDDDANNPLVNNIFLLQEIIKAGGRVVVDFISMQLVVVLLRVIFVAGRNATTSDEIISMERIHNIITTRL